MKCTPNPFIINDFVLNDFNQTSINVCNHSIDYSLNTIYCDKRCPKKCHQIYPKLEYGNNMYYYKNYSQLKIIVKSFRHFIYKVEADLEFTKFIANIGGLFGLYFGLALIDLGQVFRKGERDSYIGGVP